MIKLDIKNLFRSFRHLSFPIKELVNVNVCVNGMNIWSHGIERDDPKLIQAIHKLVGKRDYFIHRVKVAVEIPDEFKHLYVYGYDD